MFRSLVCLLAFMPVMSCAQNYPCARVGASMESSLFDAIAKDLGINTATIVKNKTKVEVLDVTPVSKVFAGSLAKEDYEKDRDSNGVALLDEQAYFESYVENQATSIVVKYTYVNDKGEKDVFIASSIMNNDECSVRFNGYMSVARAF